MLSAAVVGMVRSGVVAVAAVRRLTTGERVLHGFASELLMAIIFLSKMCIIRYVTNCVISKST